MKRATRRALHGKGPADQLAKAAEVDLRAIAKCWPCGRVRISEREIANRVAYIRRAAREGGLNASAAADLAWHLRCDPKIFIWGHSPSEGANVNTRRAGGRGDAGKHRRSNARQRPAPSPIPPPEMVLRLI